MQSSGNANCLFPMLELSSVTMSLLARCQACQACCSNALTAACLLQMLDRISEVQLVHNRQKTAAMHELLDDDHRDQASTIGDTNTEL